MRQGTLAGSQPPSDSAYTSRTFGTVVGAVVGLLLVSVGLYFWIRSGRGQLDNQALGDSDLALVNQIGAGTASESTSVGSSVDKPIGDSELGVSPNDLSLVAVSVEVLRAGGGAAAKIGDQLTVHYTGMLSDGTKFDSSLDRGQPFTFTLGAHQVIPGWEQGTTGMKVGEQRRLTVPPTLGYGSTGTPGGPIPPNATLIFEVELLKIE